MVTNKQIYKSNLICDFCMYRYILLVLTRFVVWCRIHVESKSLFGIAIHVICQHLRIEHIHCGINIRLENINYFGSNPSNIQIEFSDYPLMHS